MFHHIYNLNISNEERKLSPAFPTHISGKMMFMSLMCCKEQNVGKTRYGFKLSIYYMNHILSDIFLQICLDNKCRDVATNKIIKRRTPPHHWRYFPCRFKCFNTWKYLTNPELCPVKIVFCLFNLTTSFCA